MGKEAPVKALPFLVIDNLPTGLALYKQKEEYAISILFSMILVTYFFSAKEGLNFIVHIIDSEAEFLFKYFIWC